MPEPRSPVVKGLEKYEQVIGIGHPTAQPMPSLRGKGEEGFVLTRWQPTDDERKLLAEGAPIMVTLQTFGHGIQPLRVEIGERTAEDVCEELVIREYPVISIGETILEELRVSLGQGQPIELRSGGKFIMLKADDSKAKLKPHLVV